MTDARNKPTAHALDIRITPGEVELFATSASIQVELLRRLRLQAIERGRATMLSTPEGQTLAVCSAAGFVNVLVPVVIESRPVDHAEDEFDIDVEADEDDASLSLFRTENCTFFVSTSKVAIQLERNGQVAMTFLEELPAIAEPIPEAEVTPTMLALAEAAESILSGAWSCGYYSLGQMLLWSSGDGAMYAWDPVAQVLQRMSRPPVTARQLQTNEVLDVPEELKHAVAKLVAGVRNRS